MCGKRRACSSLDLRNAFSYCVHVCHLLDIQPACTPRTPQEHGTTRKERRLRLCVWCERSHLALSAGVSRRFLSEVEHMGEERRAQSRGPWLHLDKALTDLLEFVASRCFLHNYRQRSTFPTRCSGSVNCQRRIVCLWQRKRG